MPKRETPKPGDRVRYRPPGSGLKSWLSAVLISITGHTARVRALPSNGRPLTQWPDADGAWLEVVGGIRSIARMA